MQIRKRIPIIDPMIDACRMLPETGQGVIFVIFMLSLQYVLLPLFFGGYFAYLSFIIIGIEILFFFILLQKNLIYRKISKIKTAIAKQILWIKTKRDKQKIINLTLIGIILTLTTIIYLYFYSNLILQIIFGLLCVLFFLKSIFYVPRIYIKTIETDLIRIVDGFQRENIDIQLWEIQKIELYKDSVLITLDKEIKQNFNLDFGDKYQQERLETFLRGILPNVEITSSIA